ncbi:MAG: hypothetical protein V3S42_04480 [Candidatus Neomarinimicrobiota bacterium]
MDNNFDKSNFPKFKKRSGKDCVQYEYLDNGSVIITVCRFFLYLEKDDIPDLIEFLIKSKNKGGK